MAPSAKTNDQAPIRVELDVFSGRPNPSWMLSSEEARAIRRLLVEAEARPLPASAPPRAEPGLGYRGFRLAEGSGAEAPTWRVGGGEVETGGRRLADPQGGLEGFLLRTVPEDIRAQLASVLPKPR